MIKHCKEYYISAKKYPPGPFFIRRRDDVKGVKINGLYLYPEGIKGFSIGLIERKNEKYPWKVYMGPFGISGRNDQRNFKSFRNAVKLFRSLGRQAFKQRNST